MSVFKRGRVFWFRFEFLGRRYERSTRLKNEREAKKVEAAFRTQLALEPYGLTSDAWHTRPPTFRTYSVEFTKYVETHNAEHPGTIRFYACCLRRLLAFKPIADAPLNKIDESAIEQYTQLRRRTVLPATVNHELATLSKALHLARDVAKLITRVPKIRRLEGERERDFILSPDQEAAYIAVCHDDLRDLAILALDTGVRVGEAVALKWEDVSLGGASGSRLGHIHIRQGKTKNAKRTLSITPRVRDMLDNRLMFVDATTIANPTSPLVMTGPRMSTARAEKCFVFPGRNGHISVNMMEWHHVRARNAARMEDGSELPKEDFVLHSLRHTFATRMGEAGADAFTIMRAMGHGSVRISAKYVHPTPDSMERAFERLDAMNRIMRGEMEVHDDASVKSKR